MSLNRIIFSLALLFSVAVAWSQGRITGTVTSDGEPVPFATVKLSADQGTLTDQSGKFELALPYGDYMLKISSIGFESLSRAVTLSGNLHQST